VSPLLLGLAAQAAVGDPAGEREIPRIVRPRDCGSDRSEGEIVVCGRKEDPEKYRMRGEGRSPLSSWRSGQSWGALAAEEEQRSRYGSQTVGPFGYLQYGAQQVREWRLDRAEMAKAKRDLDRMIDEAAEGAVPD
jgi:hypothetical protein